MVHTRHTRTQTLLAIGISTIATFANAAAPKEQAIRATLNRSESRLLDSVLAPNAKDREESLEQLNALRSLHSRAMAVWSRSFRRVDGSSRAFVVGTSLTEYRGWPRVYREFVHRVARNEPAVVAVALGIDSSVALELLEEKSQFAAADEATTAAYRCGLFYFHLLRGASQAAEAALGRTVVTSDDERRRLEIAFESWKQRPLDVKSTTELLLRSRSIHGSEPYSLARVELAWRSWDAASSDIDRARVALALAECVGSDWALKWKGIKITRTLAIAAARFAKDRGDTNLLADSMIWIAKAELEARHPTLACALFEHVAVEHPTARAWHLASWNAGGMLRRQKRFEDSARILGRLLAPLESIEAETSSSISYSRYGDILVALELAKTHESAGQLRRAYRWLVAARYGHPGDVVCGTCYAFFIKRIDRELERIARQMD